MRHTGFGMAVRVMVLAQRRRFAVATIEAWVDRPSVTGNPSEYATLPKAFVRALLDDLAAWIAVR